MIAMLPDKKCELQFVLIDFGHLLSNLRTDFKNEFFTNHL